MKGGRLIGEGTYGCIFQPPLLCKSKGRVNQKKVGKVTVQQDAENEAKISNRLRKIPLAANYFILNDPEVCELAPISEQTDKNIAQCSALTRQNEHRLPYEEAREVFAPFGGKTSFYTVLTKYDFHPRSFDFFAFMQHLLEAGATMAVAGVCHLDLHPNNLLVDTVGVVRILDFGFSFLADEISKELVDDRWKVLFFGGEKDGPHSAVTNMEAPEITVLNGIRNKMTPEKAIEAVVTFKEIFRDMEKYLGISKGSSQASLENFWKTSESAKTLDTVKCFKLYWPGFDAWSIGCLLMYVLKKSIMVPEFTQGEWVQKQRAVYATLRGLLEANPTKRMDCVEALATFDVNNDWINRFGKRWLATREIQRGTTVIKKIETSSP